MMASEKGVVASGLDSDNQSTRRRNVPSTSASGPMVNRVEADDKKTQIKKASNIITAEAGPAVIFTGWC
jgi:dolichyl-phosphate-mannose-protein mannosyltransferase